MFSHLFILGRNPALSVAELSHVIPGLTPHYTLMGAAEQWLWLESDTALHAQKLIDRLGGTIKIAKVDSVTQRAISKEELVSHIAQLLAATPSPRIEFGISLYGDWPRNVSGRNLGFTVKRFLTQEGKSARVILPIHGHTLNAAQVVKSLGDHGVELILARSKESVLIGHTEAVQDIDSYRIRDIERPHRSMKTGMMPPKLAQIMINCADLKEGQTLLDPFVGLGTILIEGIRMGLRVIGSDRDAKALADTKENLVWYSRFITPLTPLTFPPKADPPRAERGVDDESYHLFQSDVKTLPQHLRRGEVAAIVTEGTLGPRLERETTVGEAREEFNKLRELYQRSFKAFRAFLPTGGRVVITFPAYKIRGRVLPYPYIDDLRSLGYNTDCLIAHAWDTILSVPFLSCTGRGSLIYSREDQFVAREIFRFTLKG
ncbi:MAG: hypothetical protein HY459_00450 [Parcubacteria group bacterium]|nr:hypothetical protein [Parcubacteria group bacterium]